MTHKKVVFIAFFFPVFLAFGNTCAAQGGNLLVNGDLETGDLSPWEGASGAYISTEAAHDGLYGVHIPSGGNSPYQRWIAVEPGKTYVLTAWYKWHEFSGVDWGYDMLGVTEPLEPSWVTTQIRDLHSRYEKDVWNKIALTFDATTDGVQVGFGVYGPQDNVDMYFDDIELFEKTGNLPPTINPTSDLTTGSVPLIVQFSANGEDPDGAIQYYDWEFGDGTVSRLEDPAHKFLKRGTYTVNLTVWDNDGASVYDTLTITVSDAHSPTITITSPTSQETHTTASTSIAPEGDAGAASGDIETIVWDNINTDEAGILSMTPSSTLSWETPFIQLKPGRNEIVMTATDTQGRIDTDRIIINRGVSGPVVSNIQAVSDNVNVYERYEFTFDLETVADRTFFSYDTEPPPGIEHGTGVTVEGIFTSPGGKTLTQPGFYITEATTTGSGSSAHYEETNNKHWAVRFTPQETGTYDVSLRVRDASGETTVPVGTFTASSPVKKGFIRVSQDDTRYFEFTNGDLFWPTGPSWGFDYPALNFDRPWMGGQGAYSTNWARWMSTAMTLGNEGYGSPLEFREHYPSHELSRYIYYPEAGRIWMGCWGDDQFCPDLEANTDYQVKVRLKTMYIDGPADPAHPYGFMIKTHDWPTETLEEDLRPYPSMIPVVNQDLDWHTVVAEYTATSRDGSNPYISLFLDNVNSGEVYIDQFSIREVLSDGSLGPEQIRHSKADMHTYVEQRPAAYFDWQVEQGEQDEVYFKYVVHDKNDWIQNHLTGLGFFNSAGDGYYQGEDTKATWLLKQWYRYLIGRWGYSTSVHSWELNNEGPPDSSSHWDATQRFAEFMHDNDAHPHLATTSFWCCWRPAFWGESTNFPDIDYADIHQYTQEETFPDGSLMAYDMARFQSEYSMEYASDDIGKPIIRAETGISSSGNPAYGYLEQPNPGIWYHNLLWAQLNPGGMSDPGYWWSGHLNQIDREQVAQPFIDFVSSLDLNRGGYFDAGATSTNTKLRTLGQKNTAKDRAHLWIQNEDHTWRNVMGVDNPTSITGQSGTITIQMSPDTDYDIQWWDTYNGVVEREEKLSSDGSGNIILTVSGLYDDTAVLIGSADFHRADISEPFGCIDMEELTAFIQRWLTNSQDVSMPELMEAVTLWRAGTGCASL